MMREQRTALFLILILGLGVVAVSHLGLVKAEPIIDICIRTDGSVEGTDKIQRAGNLYTLTANIYDRGITVLKDDVVLDGAGHILRGRPGGIGLGERDNVTIKNFIISTNGTSDNINLYYCSNCTILNNTITPFIESYPGGGIAVWGGGSHVIAGNQLMNNLCGIFLGEGTSDNSIFDNTITNNTRGVHIAYSKNNNIYNNTFNNKFDIFGTSQNNNIYENQIIPEFPSWTAMLAILTLLAITVAIYRRRMLKTPMHHS